MAYATKLQVFISSTFTDLRRERQAAVAAILENGHIPAGMELFAAGDEEQMKVIRRWIDESDIFMLILGGRYGSIEPNSGKSYTHLEYEYAVQQKKPLFAVVMTDKSREARVRNGELLAELTESAAPEKLADFGQLVTRRLCKFPDDEKDIKLDSAVKTPPARRRRSCGDCPRGSGRRPHPRGAPGAPRFCRRFRDFRHCLYAAASRNSLASFLSRFDSLRTP
ncbi:MAG: DUF4062 domain-containing protein [Planctomycetes bacterium]|nr:DUF4062 domain-containing protein [Planctomycetota bacterium]